MQPSKITSQPVPGIVRTESYLRSQANYALIKINGAEQTILTSGQFSDQADGRPPLTLIERAGVNPLDKDGKGTIQRRFGQIRKTFGRGVAHGRRRLRRDT